ncbi:hypothetical protein ACNHUS_26280 [Actinomycetes bacterium M1A6_2h]
MRRALVVLESTLVVVAVVASVVLWREGMHVDSYGPLLPGSPGFSSTYYSGPWIGASVAAFAAAALLTLDVARRLVTKRLL